MTNPSDLELWASVVAARRELHRAQAQFYQEASDTTAVLREALRDRGWDQTTALRYLDMFSKDTLSLLPELVGLVISDRTHGWACEAIGHVTHEQLIPELDLLIREHLDSEDEYAYWRLGNLLGRIQAWPLLRELIQRARDSEDPEIREAGRAYAETYDFLDLTQDQTGSGTS